MVADMKQRIAVAILTVYGISGISMGAGADAASLPANQTESSNEYAKITVDIQSNIYKYTVSNLSSSSIVGFEVAQHAAYNFQVPDGWQTDTSGKFFKAWTDTPEAGIGPDETGDFSMRVSSKGAVLGRSPATVKLESGRMIELEDVWRPVPEPKSYIALVAGVIFLIALLHSAIIIKRTRRTNKPKATG